MGNLGTKVRVLVESLPFYDPSNIQSKMRSLISWRETDKCLGLKPTISYRVIISWFLRCYVLKLRQLQSPLLCLLIHENRAQSYFWLQTGTSLLINSSNSTSKAQHFHFYSLYSSKHSFPAKWQSFHGCEEVKKIISATLMNHKTMSIGKAWTHYKICSSSHQIYQI